MIPFGQILFFLILVAVPLSGTATDLDKDEIISKRATEEESRAAIGQGGEHGSDRGAEKRVNFLTDNRKRGLARWQAPVLYCKSCKPYTYVDSGDGAGRSRFLRKDDTCGRIQPKQKEKRHECNFNEAVT